MYIFKYIHFYFNEINQTVFFLLLLSVRGGAPAGIETVGVKIEIDHCFIPTHFGIIPDFPLPGMNTE